MEQAESLASKPRRRRGLPGLPKRRGGGGGSGSGGGGDATSASESGVVIVIDCSGAALPTVRRFAEALLPTFPDLAKHYPERLAKVYVVNAFSGVPLVWKLFVQPFVTEETRKKVSFVDGGGGDALAGLRAPVGDRCLRKIRRIRWAVEGGIAVAK